MERDREHIFGVAAARTCSQPCARKNRSRAVALMDVAVNRHRFSNFFVALHAADGNGHIVEHAETFAVIGEGMMESSANVDGDAVVERMISGQHRAAGRKPKGTHQLWRVRNFEL